jgi:hypothetical protein
MEYFLLSGPTLGETRPIILIYSVSSDGTYIEDNKFQFINSNFYNSNFYEDFRKELEEGLIKEISKEEYLIRNLS